MAADRSAAPGLVALLGSGETAPSGGAVFERVARGLGAPPRIAVLETPAGFQPNSAHVAGRVVEYLRERLRNYHPQVASVAARQRDTPFSPDDPALIDQLAPANMFVLGPGSPSYAARQLAGSRAWATVLARHREGAAIVLSSAAVIAASAYALPVYEIYKVGAAPHWVRGLDLFGAFGLALALVPHWNNNEGGKSLDTSHCFMGGERFARLLAFLPPAVVVVGIDEHTSLLIDADAQSCQVLGQGQVTLLRAGGEEAFAKGERFPISALGPFRVPAAMAGEERATTAEPAQASPAPPAATPPEVLVLAEARQAARARAEWACADVLRQQIQALGWIVTDTPAGPRLERCA